VAFPELLAVAMVVAVCALLFAGYPVALTLGGVSFAFARISPVRWTSASSTRCRSASSA
jgi:TRAP-type mannitol/chloroaromatic compound transport system permease large subunit